MTTLRVWSLQLAFSASANSVFSNYLVLQLANLPPASLLEKLIGALSYAFCGTIRLCWTWPTKKKLLLTEIL